MPISDVLRAEIDRRARYIANDAMVNGDARGTLELIRSCVLHFATRAAEEAAEQCIAAVEADTRRVREELRKAEIDYESITSLPPFHAGMVSWSGADECGCLPDLRAQGLHMSRCERLRDGT